MCLSVVACEQAPSKDGKEIQLARKRRNTEAIGGKKKSVSAIQKNERSDVCQSMYIYGKHTLR